VGGTEAYSVGPGDQLQIVVRKEPELTRDVVVRPDGRITVPLLGDIDAAGKTPAELADEITRGLARFVNAPRVTVGVGQAVSARVFVIGQVNRAGEVSLTTPLTVVQALALAGGFREFAKRESILVVGRDRKVRTFNFKKFESGQDLDSNVVLRPGDTVVVP
jgi:polysaccharide export outer membrane protein